MGHRLRCGCDAGKGVSVSALSDHLMGREGIDQFSAGLVVSVSALSDHLMGHWWRSRSYCYPSGFSIRSFGSFDGTKERILDEMMEQEFQYPLFRII